MKVLVVGGAGNIGAAVVDAAAKAGHDVYPITRRCMKYNKSFIHPIQADWSDDETAKRILSENEYDVIVDGLMMQLPQAKRDLELAKGRCKQFVFISSDGVYKRPAQNVTEDVAILMKDIHWDIMQNKRKIELYIKDFQEQFPYMITTIRPSVTYGRNRVPCAVLSRKNQWTLIDRIIKDKPVVFIEDGGSLHPIVPAEVFGDAVVGLFLNKAADGETYHVAAEGSYKWDDVAYAIGKIVQHEPKIVHIPLKWLKKFNRQLYIEVLYDKLDTLTLDITKLKEASPNANYGMDLKDSLVGTVAFLYETMSINSLDESFNTMCDRLLMEYAHKGNDGNERCIAQEYTEQLDDQEKNRILLQSKEMMRRDRSAYIFYVSRRTALELLPGGLIEGIRKMKHSMLR